MTTTTRLCAPSVEAAWAGLFDVAGNFDFLSGTAIAYRM
jgi:hypothetical protein